MGSNVSSVNAKNRKIVAGKRRVFDRGSRTEPKSYRQLSRPARCQKYISVQGGATFNGREEDRQIFLGQAKSQMEGVFVPLQTEEGTATTLVSHPR